MFSYLFLLIIAQAYVIQKRGVLFCKPSKEEKDCKPNVIGPNEIGPNEIVQCTICLEEGEKNTYFTTACKHSYCFGW